MSSTAKHLNTISMILLVLLSLALLTAAQTNQALAPRRFHTATLYNSVVFIVGGTTDAQDHLATSVQIFDPARPQLTRQIPADSLALAGHSALPLDADGHIMFLFGMGSLLGIPMVFSAENGTVADLTTRAAETGGGSTGASNGPVARMGQSAVLADDSAYVLGGMAALTASAPIAPMRRESSSVNANVNYNIDNINLAFPMGGQQVLGDVWRLDLKSMVWQPLIPLPSPLVGHNTVPAGRFLVTCFGADAKNIDTNACTIFDRSQLNYAKPSYLNGAKPPARAWAGMALSADGQTAYVFGGKSTKKKRLVYYNDVWALDLSKAPLLTWTPIEPDAADPALVPSQRAAHTVTRIGDQVLMIWGGEAVSGELADAKPYFLDVASRAWLGEEQIKAGLVGASDGQKKELNEQSQRTASAMSVSRPVEKKGTGSRIPVIVGVTVGVVLVVLGGGLWVYLKRSGRLSILGRMRRRSDQLPFAKHTRYSQDMKEEPAEFHSIPLVTPASPPTVPPPILHPQMQPKPVVASETDRGLSSSEPQRVEPTQTHQIEEAVPVQGESSISPLQSTCCSPYTMDETPSEESSMATQSPGGAALPTANLGSKHRSTMHTFSVNLPPSVAVFQTLHAQPAQIIEIQPKSQRRSSSSFSSSQVSNVIPTSAASAATAPHTLVSDTLSPTHSVFPSRQSTDSSATNVGHWSVNSLQWCSFEPRGPADTKLIVRNGLESQEIRQSFETPRQNHDGEIEESQQIEHRDTGSSSQNTTALSLPASPPAVAVNIPRWSWKAFDFEDRRTS
ncbi:uncharacterized protein VTP21DRAFT_10959 [Calcarisporiella thermophila]|uniref:uncharacterized protein n=1 Tax=Calcarisporiella thermophila TaxID=911321 RepID=UPI003743A924